jgi:uncharacterized cupredoxin-like copper-binding protein
MPSIAMLVAVISLIVAVVAIVMGANAVSKANKANNKVKTAAAPASAPAAPAAAPTTVAPAPPAPPATPNVAVTVKDFSITPSVTQAPAGLIDFNVTDNGPVEHEFLIFQTDLAPDQLPVGADGRVDESSDKISKVLDSGANIPVGSTKTFHAALVQGNYVLVCNLPGGHYKAGMHTAFTVTAPVTAAVNVAVTVKDFSITPSVTTAKGGLLDFAVTDNGPVEHEFLIFKTDLAPDQLPVGADGRVDESSDKISKVFDSGANIPVGTAKTFHAALTSGSYVLVCNLPGGHYKAGMHTAFTVS